jgi:hypothetical protein
MREHYYFNQPEFKDVIKGVQGFGISTKPTRFNDKNYFQIYKGIGIEGYVRMEGEKLYLVAADNENTDFLKIDSLRREQLFIDFSASLGESWDVCYTSDALFCDGVKFISKGLNPKLNDTTYVYKLYSLNKLNIAMPSEEYEAFYFISKKYGLWTTRWP